MHDGADMTEEKQSAMNKLKQLGISCWAVGTFLWYFHEFSPAFTPIVQRLLHRLWH